MAESDAEREAQIEALANFLKRVLSASELEELIAKTATPHTPRVPPSPQGGKPASGGGKS